jgi:hypothetical protein
VEPHPRGADDLAAHLGDVDAQVVGRLHELLAQLGHQPAEIVAPHLLVERDDAGEVRVEIIKAYVAQRHTVGDRRPGAQVHDRVDLSDYERLIVLRHQPGLLQTQPRVAGLVIAEPLPLELPAETTESRPARRSPGRRSPPRGRSR